MNSLETYMTDMGRYPLLERDEEVLLAERYERGRAAEKRLAEAAGLDPQEKRALETAVGRGEEARQRMVLCNLRLVISVVKHYAGRGLPFGDLVQEGNTGLIEAVERYDPRRGTRFSTYAVWWIRQAVSRAVENYARTVRLPVNVSTELYRLRRARDKLASRLQRRPTRRETAQQMGVSLQRVRSLLRWQSRVVSLNKPVGEQGDHELIDLVCDQDAPQIEDTLAARQLRERVHEMMASRLSRREQRVLRLRFGFDGARVHTLRQVAEVLGVTRERVRQIEAHALRKLRRASLRQKEDRDLWARAYRVR